MIMIHSDNMGLVLPPKVAQVQVAIVPIINKDDDIEAMKGKAHDLAAELKQSGLRVYVDDSEVHNPGFKFNYWELRGSPIRLELGVKDFEKEEVKVVVRYSGEKFQASWTGLAAGMVDQMEKIQSGMYNKAKQSREDHISHVKNWEDFMTALAKRDVCLAPWCDTVACEVVVKDRAKEESIAAMAEANEGEAQLTGSAKTLCIPFELGK